MKHIIQSKKAFTLMEIMVVIAIIALLSAVVLVQFQGYARGARASKALAQASSAIPSMVSCWGNGGDVASGTNICGLSASYGIWPTLPSDYTFNGNSITKTQSANPWFFTVNSASDGMTVCCNSKMNSCGQPASCNANATW